MERLEERDCGIHDFARQSEAEGDFASLVRLQTDGGMNGFTQNGAGIFLGDFLDFHAASGAGHEDDTAGLTIDEKAEIKFALDVQTLFDEQALDDAASGTSLRSYELHAEHVAGDVGGFVGGVRQLDAAGFAAPTGVNLRLYDDDVGVRSQAVRGLARFFLAESDFTAWSRDAVTRQNCLRLILVNLHRGSVFRSSLKQSASIRILTAMET